jgi:hypothetical protein
MQHLFHIPADAIQGEVARHLQQGSHFKFRYLPGISSRVKDFTFRQAPAAKSRP